MAVDTSKVRTVAVMGHATSGKTSLVDAALFLAKANDRHGRVADGSSAADSLPDEIARREIVVGDSPRHPLHRLIIVGDVDAGGVVGPARIFWVANPRKS